jgi:hypothetical protein
MDDEIGVEIHALRSSLNPRKRFQVRRVGGGWIVVDAIDDLKVSFHTHNFAAVRMKIAMEAQALAAQAPSAIPLAKLVRYRAWLEECIAEIEQRRDTKVTRDRLNYYRPKLDQVRLLIAAGEEPLVEVKRRAQIAARSPRPTTSQERTAKRKAQLKRSKARRIGLLKQDLAVKTT